jgi:peptidoglycan/xylan/chitin deacetylase (PgdA/CDA1 family)
MTNRRVLFLTLLLCLAGCSSSPGIGGVGALPKKLAEAATMATDTPTLTDTPAPTLTVTSTATPTPLSTATATPTPTPSPTPTVTPAPTETPSSTPPPTETPTPLPPTPTYPPPPEVVHVPILMYHYVSELPEDADVYRRDLTVIPAHFEEQLQYLQVQGYQSILLADIYETLTTGKPLPEKPVVLTFDDGYKDAYTGALPLLQKYGFVGEFFVLATPAHYESPQYLTWADVRAMADAGMSMQAHGRDHYDLTERAYDFLVYQILGAKEAVEAHSGQPVRFFCYPSGRYDNATIAVVESAGYWGAVTTAWGAELRLDNRFTWPRIRVKGNWSLDNFVRVIEQVTP